MERTHKIIERYITDNMALLGIPYSLTKLHPRDFTDISSPLLSDGDDNYIIFTVKLDRSVPAAVGDTARRLTGTVRVEFYLSKTTSDREFLRMADSITEFLEAKSFEGVRFRDFTISGEYKEGKWHVKPAVATFNSTKMKT